jgi:hypothetical protein
MERGQYLKVPITPAEIRKARMVMLLFMGALAVGSGWMALRWPLYGYLYAFCPMCGGDNRIYPYQHVIFEFAVFENFGPLAFSIWAFYFFLTAKPVPSDQKGPTR